MNKRLVKKVMAACTAGAIAGALVLIPAYEGVEYMPYRDVAGVLTVCYGHTGSDIQPGKLYTDAECKALLHDDLTKVRRAVDPMIKVPIDDNTRAAIYSFVYNVGPGAFSRSTMLRKLNTGDIAGACSEMKRWTFAGGKQWHGLINRRDTENAVCHKPLTLIIIAIILLTTALLAGCYLYSLPNYCKPLQGYPLDGVIHYKCEAL